MFAWNSTWPNIVPTLQRSNVSMKDSNNYQEMQYSDEYLNNDNSQLNVEHLQIKYPIECHPKPSK